MIHISATNVSTAVVDAEVQACIAAIELQINRDVAPVWGTDQVQFTFLPKGSPLPAGAWQLVFADDSDQAGALGYHELNANGGPIGFVFCKDTMADGGDWHVTASHEAIEMVGDPWINRTCEVETANGNSTFYMQELCDACEDDSFGYQVLGLLMSDFVTPAWFLPGVAAPFDFKGHIGQSLQVLHNGYIADFPAGATNWNEVLGALVGKTRAQLMPSPLHRRHRRLMWRSKWKRSER